MAPKWMSFGIDRVARSEVRTHRWDLGGGFLLWRDVAGLGGGYPSALMGAAANLVRLNFGA